MRRSLIVCAAISSALVGARAALADILTLQQGLNGYTGTRDDAALQSTDPSTYPNLDDRLYAYSTISGPFLGTVVGFDISSVPANAVINSATLTMTFDQNSIFGNGASQGFQVKNPTQQWTEGQVNYYFAQTSGPGVLWNSSDQPFGSGGSGITMANQPVLATASVSGSSLAGVGLNFDVTSLVNGWYGGSMQNRGFAVLNDGSGDPAGNMSWAGKANSTQAWRPELSIDYTVFSPGWKSQSGDWNDSTNWIGGVPNAVDAVATFSSSITASRTVFTDIATTVGTINFDNSSNSYVISGAGSLTMQASGSAGINVLSGSHKINLPLTFASNTMLNIASGATLTIGNPTTISANKTVTQSGGNLLIQAPLTIQSGGALVLGSQGASLFSAPSLASGAKIDVKNSSMTVNYQGQSSPAATIKSQLASGFNHGAWNGSGIDTSSSTSHLGLGWKDSSSSQSITVKYAYYGDANLDGQVNSDDFAALAANFGKTGSAEGWVQGDFNYDGIVNTLDFNALATDYGQVLSSAQPAALGAVVPEPASGALILLGAATILGKRKREGIKANR